MGSKRRTNTVKRNELVEQYRSYAEGVVGLLIKTMGIPSEMYDELKSAAYLGLVEAAQHYDTKRGADFRNYSFLRIRGAIIDSLRRLSELSDKAYRFAKALRAIQDLREFDYDAPAENALEQGTPVERIAKIFDYAAKGAIAFRLSIDEVEEEATEFIDNAPNPEEQFELDQKNQKIREMVATLPKNERLVIEGYYFNDRSFVEIADENAELSKSWTSRLHARALDMLKKRMLDTAHQDGDIDDNDADAVQLPRKDTARPF